MLGASLALSAGVTGLAIHYARRRNLIDQPGRRRSHTQPTPRGGGIGIVVAALALLGGEMLVLPNEALPDLVACAFALALVATVGWIDDHGGLAARWRLLAHFVAAAVVLTALPGAARGGVEYAGFAVLALFGLVWSINLHNFMDGIDGLLAWQALFFFAAMAILMAATGADADALHLGALAAAVAGFVPFNSPRARVFMGDVGSGALGLLIGVAALRQLGVAEVAAMSGLIAASAFVIDATCNLLSRMLRGRRWYSAHREHLYQWLARSGMSHARVVGWYMGWNLLVAAPVLCWINRGASTAASARAPSGLAAAAALYAAGIALWIYGKRWCLYKVKTRARHAGA